MTTTSATEQAAGGSRAVLAASNSKLHVAAMWLLGILGIVLIVLPDITFDRIPGDYGDGRFNLYVLEHFYRWATGQDSSFWTAPFFFPYSWTVAFSDNHLGNGFVYALFRGLGFDPSDSFRGWYLVGFVVNYAAALYALRRLGCSGLASASGAFLFTFGLPVIMQSMHAQLIYRFCVPLAVLALVRYERQPSLWRLAQIGGWTVWQFYCSIYIGIFLVMLLAAISVSWIAFDRGKSPNRLRWRVERLRQSWEAGSILQRAAVVAVVVASFVAMVALAVPYLQVSRLYHFHRGWPEIASMLPRVWSYLLTNNSVIWDIPLPQFRQLPMAQEHAMFFGLAPYLAIAAYIVLRRGNDGAAVRLFRVVLLALALIFVLTLSYHGHSIYRILAVLPGINAVRAVARISVVLLLPMAILTAIAIDRLLDRTAPLRFGPGLAAAVVAVMVVESAAIRHYASSKSEWQGRIDRLAAQLPAQLPADPILFVGPSASDPAFAREIDGMMLAQSRGWRTLNGYSGNAPAGHAFTGDCLDAARNLSAGAKFAGIDDADAVRSLARHIVLLGYDGCPETSARVVSISAFRGPLSFDQMAKTSIRIDRVRSTPAGQLLGIDITNSSGNDLSALSLSDAPIRVSAIYVDAAITSPAMIRPEAWTARHELVVDVPAGKTEQIGVPMPPPPDSGEYRIAVSLVQEGVAWFHDHGMAIALSDPIAAK